MRLGILLLILFANTSSAGTHFTFVVESTGDPLTPRRAGTIRVDGPSYRLDYGEDVFGVSSVFSTDGGRTETALNSMLSTYFRPRLLLSEFQDSRLFSMPWVDATTPSVLSVKDVFLRQEPVTDVIAGHATTKYVLRLAYDVKATLGKEKIRAVFSSTVELWTTDKIEESFLPLDPRRLRTGQSAVDKTIREALSSVKGFPLKRRLTVTRKIAGGQSMSDVVTTSFEDFKSVVLSPDAVAVPTGYRYQEPIIGAPGRR